MAEKKEFFDRMAGIWDRNLKKDSSKLLRVIRESRILPGQRVLDAGAGTGILVPYLLKAVGSRGSIYALDFSPGMVEQMRKKKFPSNVYVVFEDIHRTSFSDCFFDQVIANASFPHFVDQGKALKEIYRLLKPGGNLVISHPAGRDWVNRHHRQISSSVAEDVVLPAYSLSALLTGHGFSPWRLIDEPDFYLVAARRPE